MLNEIQYCERLFHLMHVQGLFEESADTVEGSHQHERAEQRRRKGEMAPAELWGAAPLSLHLGDETLGLTGKLDSLVHEDGCWIPVEGKHSASPSADTVFQTDGFQLSGAAWPNDQIQLCAQGLLLRSNGYASHYGYLYYRKNKAKIRIDFTDELVNATLYFIQKAQQLEQAEMPKPLIESNKCFRCSLNYVCLPDETNYLTGVATPIRRIVPSRSDGGVVYVAEAGTKLGVHGESLIVTSKEGVRFDPLPIKDLVHVCLMGSVQPSTQLMHVLFHAGVTVSYLSTHGRLVGIASPLTTKNVHLRKQQFMKFQHPDVALRLARFVIHAKIANQRTLLRRNGVPATAVLKELMALRKKSEQAASLDTLRGYEGAAGRLFMSSFSGMLKWNETESGLAIMNGRNRRPPKDPVNALLSFGYSLLTRDVVSACAAVGFDPMFGFFHMMEPGRPALALDLMEPYRPLIVDSVVIRVLNTKEIGIEDFYWGPDSCQLKKNGRLAFLNAYERRMHEEFVHPIFGYKISYRRALDMEARMLARHLEGDLPEYRPLTTR